MRASFVFSDTTGDKKMLMQVTRVTEQKTWKNLDETANVTGELVYGQMTDQLLVALQSKAEKMSMRDRSEIVIVLDARHAPQALPSFVDEFCLTHSGGIRALGFQAVWLVGPTPDSIRRLDEAI